MMRVSIAHKGLVLNLNVSVLTTRGPTVATLLVQWSEGTNYTYACFELFTLYIHCTLLLENLLKNNISKEKEKIFCHLYLLSGAQGLLLSHEMMPLSNS